MNKQAIKYFKADLAAKSPVKLSSGADGLTDSDVIVDACNLPFVPGTTICGVTRHYMAELHEESFVNRWFGRTGGRDDPGSESLVRFHDAFPIGKPSVSSRDGVKLDEHKTAVANHKYDYQVVDAGARFTMRIEVLYDPDTERGEAEALLSEIAQGFQSGEVRIGGKASRGFGEMELENLRSLDIDLRTQEGVDAYVEFDWERSPFEDFEASGVSQGAFESPVHVPLEVVSSLMIRDYGSMAPSGHEGKFVDAETLKDAKGRPVVPGTSWAGAFRGHMLKVLKAAKYDEANGWGDTTEGFLDRVFGSVGGPRAIASKVLFSESSVEGAVQLNSTRNAIDRFTGGVADQKLFTNRLSYGGTTELVIRWRKDFGGGEHDGDDKRLFESLVEACVADLCDGMLAVGGMTATGSGVFRKRAIDEGEGAYV